MIKTHENDVQHYAVADGDIVEYTTRLGQVLYLKAHVCEEYPYHIVNGHMMPCRNCALHTIDCDMFRKRARTPSCGLRFEKIDRVSQEYHTVYEVPYAPKFAPDAGMVFLFQVSSGELLKLKAYSATQVGCAECDLKYYICTEVDCRHRHMAPTGVIFKLVTE